MSVSVSSSDSAPARIVRSRLCPYTLPLRRPLVTARGVISQRSGVLIALEDANGMQGRGDAAPLPGFSVEHLDACQAALSRALAAGGPLMTGAIVDLRQARCVLDGLQLPPAARHAIDQALLELLARRAGWSVAQLLAQGERPRRRVPVHALITDAQQACAAVARGYSVLKLKVGAQWLAHDLERVRAIRDAIGVGPTLRVDVNGAWDEATASEALRNLAPYGLQCVEQPVAASELSALARLRRQSSVPIAVDESVRREEDLARVIDAQAADMVVIKPMLCGGLQSSLALARCAEQAGLALSVTTCFDSVVGRLAALHVAAAMGGDLWSCGIDTGELLAADVVSLAEVEGMVAEEGYMHVTEQMGYGFAPWPERSTVAQPVSGVAL